MTTHIKSLQILRDKKGQPAFAVIPFADYQVLVDPQAIKEPSIPLEVVDKALGKDISATRAWRIHLELTQAEVAKRMGITQGAYCQLEARKTIRKSSRVKVAKALNIDESQLVF